LTGTVDFGVQTVVEGSTAAVEVGTVAEEEIVGVALPSKHESELECNRSPCKFDFVDYLDSPKKSDLLMESNSSWYQQLGIEK
jgi:hypothetical protein